ncbi:cystathionine gamma-lyase-like [Pollicipes pollicipes]|uniref:cystathionine gamma-lyase-like n=1 Tax=Pollicipes pollicipes TaxID=41117 RepID=UPI0018851100|nr:cystathionine gamma-lyase-like [Pollicipes pollicipes]XP_037086313.1 cystathionine gamma-lyase-like [Pollicipes pollicipes]
MAEYLPTDPHFATRAICEGNEPEQWNSRAVVPPISLATTFKQDGPAEHRGFEYSRSGNPTRNAMEKCYASLEKAKYGMAFASGLAATTTIVHMLSSGDHIVSMDDLYGGTNRYLTKVASRMGIETTFVDAVNTQHVADAIKDSTRLVWVETPTNPTMKLVDIAAVAQVVKEHPKVKLVVDSTFMSPYFQQALALGADIVMHSATKYINGHSDVVMGLVATNQDDVHDSLRFLQNAIGPVPSPFDCYLVNRSIKTLAVRMRQHSTSALEVARFLEKHPAVERVLHPGLESHPQYALARRQTSGPSGMLSFYIRGGLAESRAFLQALKLVALAESLGGYESLAELPSLMTHAAVSEEERARLGISDSLLRVSVGLEDTQDIIDDLDRALRSAVPV